MPQRPARLMRLQIQSRVRETSPSGVRCSGVHRVRPSTTDHTTVEQLPCRDLRVPREEAFRASRINPFSMTPPHRTIPRLSV